MTAQFVGALAEVVRAHPGRVALEDRAERITYAELDARARRVARALRARGIGAEDVTGVRGDRSAALVIEMLGAWYAGAAFVVLSPALPSEREARMLADCKASLPVQGVSVGEGAGLAYVVFTSGTTGAPKGVMVEHRGVVPMLREQIDAFAIEPGSRCLWALSPMFDASISDVGTALLAGATLVIDSDGLTSRAPDEIAARLGELRVTHADLPPALLSLLDERAMPASLRTIVVGGEVCPDATVARFAPRVRLVSVYGPTEATVCTSMRVCAPGQPHGGRLGVPISTARYRVVDDQMRDVAPAEKGELLIGGPCLARGYANDPELTQRRFVVLDGQRFYRTGDRVQLLASGEAAFVGRLDRQAKVAGVRVEPEEIEAHLRGDEDVAEAAVVKTNRILTAFVARKSDQSRGVDTVRERLAARVPPWLVPARFVPVKRLPRTPSGKVDLGALASLRHAPSAGPRDEVERLLCEAMANALGVAEVGREDDFERLGGDSLAALEVCAAAFAAGRPLSPEQLRAGRTPAAIAAALGEDDAMPARALRAEVEALAAVTPIAAAPGRGAAKPRSILLTGAAGFLGSRLLRAIADASDATVTCVVRAEDDDAAARRLAPLPPRARAFAGDLSRDRFGLAPARFAELAAEVDTIVHAAASVDLTLPFASLRASNLDATARVIAFAAEGAPKSLHHVSTLSVLAGTDLAPRLGERAALGEDRSVYDACVVRGGYAQTKWAAEALVRRAAPGASVHRLGLLTGDSTGGACGRHDLVAAFVRGIAALGAVPEDASQDELRFDVTPADFAARALAHLALHPAPSRTRHLANRRSASLGELLAAMAAEGVRLVRVDAREWSVRLGDACGLSRPSARARLRGTDAAAVLGLSRSEHRAFDLFEATGCDFGSCSTLDELARAGIDCPEPTQRLLRLYVRRALEVR